MLFSALLRWVQRTSLVTQIIIGLLVGLVARFIKPGDDSMGWILTILLGIAGAYAGSWLGPMIGISGGMLGFVVSIVCAIVLLFIYEALRKKKA